MLHASAPGEGNGPAIEQLDGVLVEDIGLGVRELDTVAEPDVVEPEVEAKPGVEAEPGLTIGTDPVAVLAIEEDGNRVAVTYVLRVVKSVWKVKVAPPRVVVKVVVRTTSEVAVLVTIELSKVGVMGTVVKISVTPVTVVKAESVMCAVSVSVVCAMSVSVVITPETTSVYVTGIE